MKYQTFKNGEPLIIPLKFLFGMNWLSTFNPSRLFKKTDPKIIFCPNDRPGIDVFLFHKLNFQNFLASACSVYIHRLP